VATGAERRRADELADAHALEARSE
jgi:hypothetical protein